MKKQMILKHTYYDSVTLMRTSNDLKQTLGLNELILLMGTPMNKEMIAAVHLYDASLDIATPNDLMIAYEGKEMVEDIASIIEDALVSKQKVSTKGKQTYQTLNQAASQFKPNIAVISVPGIYAAHEAYNALKQDMHVMLFSDNVAIEDEIKLKDFATKKNLLMMGPDCGTAIIQGAGLCFANKVRRGSIGIVAASGTGLQEVSVLIDVHGGGVSQAIGVGGRDLNEQVGGKMTLHALKALKSDDATKVVVLISKPPHESVTSKILDYLKDYKKPVVLCLLDAKINTQMKHVHSVNNLTDAALKALDLIDQSYEDLLQLDSKAKSYIKLEQSKHDKAQTFVKGLFNGGTLAAESLSIIRPFVSLIKSNVAKNTKEKIIDPFKSQGHQIIDLGDDVFTLGKPHPMIEPTIRLPRILLEANNPETKVILLDFELGYGSHDDAVGVTLNTLKEAFKVATKQKRHLSVIAYVLGTDADLQDKAKSIKQLESIGVFVAKSNAQGALIAAHLVKEI